MSDHRVHGYARSRRNERSRTAVAANEIMSIETLQRYIARGRVPLGFLLGAVCLVFADPRPWSMAAGAAFALIGLLWRAWASGHLRKNERLATGGPYAHTRNPLYFGSFLLGVGFSVATGRIELAALFVVFFLSIYLPVMRSEAHHMSQIFPEEYADYQRNVPMFRPRLRPWDGCDKSSYDWRLYMRYREYRAFIGTVAAIAILGAKVYFINR